VKLAAVMPWEELGAVYNKALSWTEGRPSLSARVVVGALIIKHMLDLTDEETIAQIRGIRICSNFWGIHVTVMIISSNRRCLWRYGSGLVRSRSERLMNYS